MKRVGLSVLGLPLLLATLLLSRGTVFAASVSAKETLTISPTSFTAGANCPGVPSGWTCTVTLGETSGSQGNLAWTANTSLNGVTFTPSSGTLSPGSSASVAIFVPTSACTNGTFSFVGPKNTVKATWKCKMLTASPTSLTPFSCTADGTPDYTYHCTLTLANPSYTHGAISWSASSSMPGVTFSPSHGRLAPGFEELLTIQAIPACANNNTSGTLSFSGGTTPTTVAWTCQLEQANAVGVNPIAVAVGDLNGDGRADIVSANADGSVSVLLNNGDGTFAPQVLYKVGSEASGVALGDFNGDGKLDIVATSIKDNTVSVLLNNGNGTFAPQALYKVGNQPAGVAVGDLNGDGKLDIAVADFGDNTVSVLAGKGDGTFFPSPPGFSVGHEPQDIALGDFNGDGKLDVVTANFGDNTISVLLNTGNQESIFAPQVTYSIGSEPAGVAVADLNGDTRPDIVTANAGDNTTSVLLNNGDGTFASHTYSVGTEPAGVALVDINRDGKPDIVTTDLVGNTISVLLNNGDGTFASQVEYSVGSEPFGVAVGDLNGDGCPDLVTANFNGDTVSVVLNNGFGGY